MARRGRGEMGKAGPHMATSDSCTPILPTAKRNVPVYRPSVPSDTQPNQGRRAGKKQNASSTAARESTLGTAVQAKHVVPPSPPPPPAVVSLPVESVDIELPPDVELAGNTEEEVKAMEAFDAALALLAAESSTGAPLAAVRALMAAVVHRAEEATNARDDLEDRCNELAAENQAVAAELTSRHNEAKAAQESKAHTETVCREKNQSQQAILQRAREHAEDEDERLADLRDKFDRAVPNIRERLDLEADRRQKQRNDNKELRGKLKHFAEQTELSSVSFEAQLNSGAVKIDIAKAQCNQQEAENKAREAREAVLRAELDRANESYASMKAQATDRERCLSRIQTILNDRKKTSAALEAKTKELRAEQKVLEKERDLWIEARRSSEAAKAVEKVVYRFKSICCQLEPEVKEKTRQLQALQESQTANVESSFSRTS